MKEPKDYDSLGFWIFMSVFVICCTIAQVYG